MLTIQNWGWNSPFPSFYRGALSTVKIVNLYGISFFSFISASISWGTFCPSNSWGSIGLDEESVRDFTGLNSRPSSARGFFLFRSKLVHV